MLEVDRDVKRVKTDFIQISEQKVFRVKIPNFKPRILKKAGKMLFGKRAIIGEDYDEKLLLKYGIVPITPQKLCRYLAGKIYLKTLEKFEMLPEKTAVSIFGGGLANFNRFGLDKIIKNVGYLGISSRDSENFAEYIMEEYGISATRCMRETDVSVFICEKEFALHCESGNRHYILRDVKILTAKNISNIPETHLKSGCLALIEAGSISVDDIVLDDLIFSGEKLT